MRTTHTRRTARAARGSFLADDEETLRDATRALEEDARGSRGARSPFAARGVPSRRALLNRACAARAWKCLRLLLGGPWVSADTPDAHDGLDKKKSAHFFSCASTEAIGNALHVSLRRGDAEAAETIRSVMGDAFARPPPFSSTRAWPLSPLGDGGTPLHSAAENDARTRGACG